MKDKKTGQNIVQVNTRNDIKQALERYDDVWITLKNNKDYVYCETRDDGRVWINLGPAEYLLTYNLAVNSIYDYLRELNRVWDEM